LGQHCCPNTYYKILPRIQGGTTTKSDRNTNFCAPSQRQDRIPQSQRFTFARFARRLTAKHIRAKDEHMYFASDNAARVAPAILQGIAAANDGFAPAYGDDAVTRRVEQRFCKIFEREVAVFLVPTGTAANALALAHLAPPWGAVMCHREAHVISNECGAPEFFGGGLRLVGLDGEGGKIAPETLALALDRHEGHSPHQMVPATVSLTQATEAGTVYRTDEVAALSSLAHERGLAVHMDGARFANALVRLGVSPAQITWQAGIDVLSFGATKGGALAAEAVVFFDPERAATMAERRKRAGHLVSKHRFIAAQFEAFLADGLWLDLASHANRMADRLAATLKGLGLAPVWNVEANLVFVLLPQGLHEHLQAVGAQYYAFHSDGLPGGKDIPAGHVLARLVTSFATTDADIEAFAAHAKGTRSRPSFA
jgi:threonine aldolase